MKTPADTWSNIGYVLVGAFVVIHARKSGRSVLAALGAVAVVTGVGSAFYHASGARIAMLADYGGMFLGTAALTALNVRRAFGWRGARFAAVLLATAALSLTAVAVAPGHERTMFAAMMPCCVLEAWLFVRERPRIAYGSYAIAWLLLAIGMVAWWMDLSRRWCSPDNHLFTGHSIWHVATAAAYVFLYRHYSQIDWGRTSPGKR